MYTKEDVLEFVEEQNVKFIRCAFFDVLGTQKNVSIQPSQLKRAFETGISFDGSAVTGFNDESHSDLILKPDPNTMTVLPWRSIDGLVIRMYCTIYDTDGSLYKNDTRYLLKQAIQKAKDMGVSIHVGNEFEFYLFKTDSDGKPTKEPYDDAMLYDIPPEDKCDEIRRKICLTLEEMGARPNNAFHEAGPGQNKITFGYYSPLTAGNHFTTLKTIIKNEAAKAGLYADFSPKPLPDMPGNGFHINISVRSNDGGDNHMAYAIAGILKRIREIAAFLNPSEESFKRLSVKGAPKYISWTSENHAHLLKVPEYVGAYRQAELRSPDSTANPYLVFALIIYACLEGINNQYELPPVANFSFRTMPQEVVSQYELFPHSFEEASEIARNSEFVKKYVPEDIINMYLNRK